MPHDRAWVLKNIIETIPYLVFWKDRNSNYLGCNEGFARAAGLNTSDDIVGKNDFELPWKKGESEWFRACDRRVIESGIPELNIEEPQLQADGRQRFVSTSKVPLRNSSGEIVGVLGIYNDITERKMLEEDLRLAKDAAEVSALAKTDFLSAVSHELRTPLTLILSPVEWLLREKRSELSTSVVDSLMCVQRNADRLMNLTDDILEFSKHEVGHLKLKTQALDVSKHVKQLVLDFEPTAEARGIALKLEGVDALGCVMLDIAKFDKILINLISNALKFTPSGGEVAVSLRLRDGAMVFAVADNGIGIDIADHDRIFRRFEQIEGGSTRRYGGTGLGLSLVKVFAELMGGSVSVESALGKGATFTVRIPRMLADESINDAARDVVSYQRRAFTPEAIGHDTPAQALARGSPHVVVAEDNRDLRRYLTDLLSAEFRVTALEDGQSAYDVIRKEHPDVVVSDVMMPLMDGFELIAKLKSDPGLATIPVLLLTARAGAEMAADSIDRGADDYLTKPFSPLDLLARVRAAHRMRQLYTSLIEAERRASESEQREALQKMRAESEAKIRRLVDANIIGIFIWDFEGRIIEANDAFLRMVDYDREDLVSGRIRWTELTPPEWLDRDERRWVPELKVTGSLQPFEKEYFRKDGSRVPVLIGVATFEEDGNQGVAFVLDLTERKQAELGLRESEERFRTLVQFSFDVYWESDAQHRFIRQDFAEGLADPPAPGSEIGKTRWEVPHLEPDAEAWRKHRETLEAHLPFRDFELARPAVDGGKRYISVSGLPVFDKAGRFIGYRGVARHISERKRAEEALRDMQMQLAHANRVATMGQLSASIAHEIKQPIAAAHINARAALNFLDKSPPDVAEVRETLTCIMNDVDRASDFVDRIGSLFKKAPPRKEVVDLNAAILEVTALTRSEAVKTGVTVGTQLAGELPRIQCDRVQLQQVMLNLIVNAIQSMSGVEDGNRELHISTVTIEPEGVCVAVRDTGHGLRPESLPRLFEPFYTTKPDGMGMGLSICRSIIEAHGGRLWASANLPRGASFQFALPAIANTAS